MIRSRIRDFGSRIPEFTRNFARVCVRIGNFTFCWEEPAEGLADREPQTQGRHRFLES